MANKSSNSIDKMKPVTVSFSALMKMGLSKNTLWPGENLMKTYNWVKNINA